MHTITKPHVEYLSIDEDQAGQRLDHFLQHHWKSAPKGLCFRLLRTGQIRVNGKRAKPDYRLAAGDELRLPPVSVEAPPDSSRVERWIPECLFEDDTMMVVNKPEGLAVHGGSGIEFGLIERLRRTYPEFKHLELVHRIDRDTSGILLVAKKRQALVKLHEMLREHKVRKVYLAGVQGYWPEGERKRIELPLFKYVLASGERRVKVDKQQGQPSSTVVEGIEAWPEFSLLRAEPLTGRTHQIRVHLASTGYPIGGDDKYAPDAWNAQLAKQGLKRMFLHAWKLSLRHPISGAPLELEAPLPPELSKFLDILRKQNLKVVT
ncbi:MAG: RluA family pseudouridine synthase [Pseudomonadota bacterium]